MNDTVLRNKIRHILLQDWDPFCIGDNPHLSEEYDEFADGVMKLLQGSSDAAINQYLIAIESKLEAPIAANRRNKTVNALRALVL